MLQKFCGAICCEVFSERYTKSVDLSINLLKEINWKIPILDVAKNITIKLIIFVRFRKKEKSFAEYLLLAYSYLKALTDHLGGVSRVDSFDPQW